MKPMPQGILVSVASADNARMVNLGLTDYTATHALQQRLVERRKDGLCGDLFLVTEHPGTFTLGRRGGRENLMVSEQFLGEKNIPLVHSERGGDITYHGKGQLLIYPIVDLRQAKLSIVEYIYRLEKIMIELAATIGVVATRNPQNHGVWVHGWKLGSVGIAVRHGIAFHGLALNVNISLEPFSWVNPCGLLGVRMTSLSRESGKEVTVGDLQTELVGQLCRIFACEVILTSKDDGLIKNLMDHPNVAMHQ